MDGWEIGALYLRPKYPRRQLVRDFRASQTPVDIYFLLYLSSAEYRLMPPKQALRSGESPFTCDFPGCSSRYRRKEHLKRHQANHRGIGNVSCPHCDQKLTRKKVPGLSDPPIYLITSAMLIPHRDLLRRHIRNYHPESQLPQSRSLKACTACRQRKEICEGGSPCKSCEQRGLNCSLVEQSPPARNQDVNQSNQERPASPSIDDYVNLYFRHFHPEWPFLHAPTFDAAQEPRVLVQSVIALGMWAEGGGSARNAALTLHHRLGSAFQSQRVSFEYLLIMPTVLTNLFRANGTIRVQHRMK